MIADGYHARTDGFTSLAVLLGAIGVLFGFPLADPLVGLGITVAILFVLKDAAAQMWHRLMDAADPGVVEGLSREAATVEGVQEVDDVRVRWLGHRLEADLRIVVDEDLPTRESHRLTEEVRHRLFHAHPQAGLDHRPRRSVRPLGERPARWHSTPPPRSGCSTQLNMRSGRWAVRHGDRYLRSAG